MKEGEIDVSLEVRAEPRFERCRFGYQRVSTGPCFPQGGAIECIPAFRFLYSEENVAKDPTRTPRYATGTVRLSQSTISKDEYDRNLISRGASFWISAHFVHVSRSLVSWWYM